MEPPSRITALVCIRCNASYPLQDHLFGCPACHFTVPSNLVPEYAAFNVSRDLALEWLHRRAGMWRYAELLPLAADEAVSLGEGGTPLVPCPQAGAWARLPGLVAKIESQNPTWSFKDRLAAVAVSWGRANGRPGIVVSSSGNAGAAAAAYAVRARMPCLVLTTRRVPATMLELMRAFGAMVVATPTGPDRWRLNRDVVRRWGWLPMSNAADPPVGSHPVAIEGCKTIAIEIAEEMSWRVPDAVVVPVAYGDAVAGMRRGFEELRAAGLIERVPRMLAAETYPTLSAALAGDLAGPVATGGSGSRAGSVAAPQSTYQALLAVRATHGTAVAVPDAEIADAHRVLCEAEGILPELSAALPLAAVRRLVRTGQIASDDKIVMLVTSGGLKDLELTRVPSEPALIEPTLRSLEGMLRRRYGFVP